MKHQRKLSSFFPRRSRLRCVAFSVAAILLLLEVAYLYNSSLADYDRKVTVIPLKLPAEESSSSNSRLSAAAAVVNKEYQDQKEQPAAAGVPIPVPSPPLLLLQNYMKQHSQAALLQEEEDLNGDFSNHHRRYLLGYYSCPQQAGNRLHHLFSAFVWGIVLNRTVLVHYYTKDVCEMIGHGYDPEICTMANHQEDCDAVLHRHEWIPLYKDWKEKLRLPNLSQRRTWAEHVAEWNVTKATPVSDAILDIHNRSKVFGKRQPKRGIGSWFWKPEYDLCVNIEERLADKDTLIVDLPQMPGQFAKVFYESGDEGRSALATPEARERARDLVALGVDFLYGMLFRHIFDFQPIAMSPKLPETPDENLFLITVHSRHTTDNNNGTDIRNEMACIDEVLLKLEQQRRQHQQQPQKGDNYNSSSCLLFVMSDRVESLRLLQAHAKTRNCTALTAPKSTTSNGNGITPSWRLEHGPFSGIGFFQDLTFVTSSTAPRTMEAFIGGRIRSSSHLIQELMAYDRYNTMMMMSEGQHSNRSFTPQITCTF